MKKEKGAVTLFVIVICTVVISALLLINIGIISKNVNQEKELDGISKNYEVTNEDMERTYLKALGIDTMVTVEDVQKMIEEAKEEIKQEAKEEVKQEVKDEVKKETKLEIYPVGSIYVSTSSTKPQDIFGGEWEEYAKGRTLVGIDSTQQEFNTVNKSGGEKSHVLSITEIPSHTHNVTISGKVNSTFTGKSVTTSSSGSHKHQYLLLAQPDFASSAVNVASGTQGWSHKNFYRDTESSGAHTHTVTAQGTVTSEFVEHTATTTGAGSASPNAVTNLQPYVVVYMWRRIR